MLVLSAEAPTPPRSSLKNVTPDDPRLLRRQLLLKLQCVENGTAEVRAHAATVNILCVAAHGRAEFASAAFRKVREGTATPKDSQSVPRFRER